MSKKKLSFAQADDVPDIAPVAPPVLPPRRRPSAVPERPAEDSVAVDAAEGVNVPERPVQAPVRRASGGRASSRTGMGATVDIPQEILSKLRADHERRRKGGRKGLTYTGLVLLAVNNHINDLRTEWTTDKDEESSALFPGLGEMVEKSSRESLRARRRLTMATLTPEQAKVLDGLVIECKAPSRTALIEAALRREYLGK